MGISRAHAQRRIAALAAIIEWHLEKMRSSPFSLDYNHWRTEVRGWIIQVEALAQHTGRRTETETLHRVAQWKKAAGEPDESADD
ncbi:MAG: hypothetical protein JWP03_2175 [Phycisphaerales bacterium]|jgi:hypothetical protein|nr:hypothetical protein [Phycisphaerales bacterium]